MIANLSEKNARMLRFGCISALSVWQLLLIGSYFKSFNDGELFAWAGQGHSNYSDFVRYYVSGVMTRSNDRLRIYEVALHYQYINQLIAPLEIKTESALNFTPAMIFIMSGVSLVKLLPAYLLWTSSSLIFCMIALTRFLREVQKFSPVDTAIFALAVLCSLPAAYAVREGQWIFWFSGISLFFFLSSSKRKDIVSGLLLGVLSIKPQLGAPLAAICLGEKKWQTLLIAAVTTASLNLAAGPFIGFQNVFGYPAILAKLEKTGHIGIYPASHVSLRGLLAQFMPEQLSYVLITIPFFMSMLLIALFVYQKKESSSKVKKWVSAIAILIGWIFTPSMLSYDLTYLCVPAALTLETISPILISKMRPRSLAAWHVLMLVYPFLSWLIGLLPNNFNWIYSIIHILLIAFGWHYLNTLRQAAAIEKLTP